MIKNCRPKTVKYLLSLILISFLFPYIFNREVSAATSDNISFQGKIVRNDSGHEGMNVVNGTPACVVAGADTCDFKVSYYDLSSGGTLQFAENFQNVEIGNYGGVFDLTLGSGTSVSGLYSTLSATLFANPNNLYIQIEFAPNGTTLTETFTRMPLEASGYSILAKRSTSALGDLSGSGFVFNPIATNPTNTEGRVYYNNSTKTLKMYNGTAWVDLTTGASSVWGEGNLSSLTYSQYMATTGIGTFGPFTVDTDEERVSINGDGAKSGLSVYSNYNSSTTFPVVSFMADHSSFTGTILSLIQDGTGKLLTGYKGSSLEFEFDNRGDLHLNTDGMMYFEPFASAPSSFYPNSGEGCIYSYGGDIYWDPTCNGTPELLNMAASPSLWTDAGTFTHLTSVTDDLILGANTVAGATFVFDMDASGGNYFEIDNADNSSRLFTIDSSGNVGIGTASPGSKLDIAGASSVISNTTGDITITPSGNTIFSSGNVGIGTNNPGARIHIVGLVYDTSPFIRASDSSGSSELFRIHSDGYSNFFAGNQAGASNEFNIIYSGGSNTFVGAFSGSANTSGAYNTALGSDSFRTNTTGTSNTAVGSSSLTSNTTGYKNTSIGSAAMRDNTTGGENVAVGERAFYSNISGAYNTVIGNRALSGHIAGSFNVAMGYDAGLFYGTGTGLSTNNAQSVFIGSGTRPLSHSETNQIVIGYNALGNGSNSVTLGNDSITKTILKGNVGIGTTSTPDALSISGSSSLGVRAAVTNTNASGFAEMATFNNASAKGSVFKVGSSYPGYKTVQANDFGIYNTTSGNMSFLNDYASGNINFAAGAASTPQVVITSSGNVGIGETTPLAKLHIKGSANDEQLIVQGYSTQTSPLILVQDSSGNELFRIHSNVSSNLFMGYTSGSAISSGVGNTGMGYQALSSTTSGTGNTAIGYQTLSNNTIGGFNIGLGYNTLSTNVATQGSIAIGYEAMRYANSSSVGTYTYNTAVGYMALKGSTTSGNNTGIGNTAIGHGVLSINTSGSTNTGVGANALGGVNTGGGNTALGSASLNMISTSVYNTALGTNALTYIESGSYNTAIGGNAGSFDRLANDLTSLSNSVLLGYGVMPYASGDTNEIVIGYSAIGKGSNSVVLGNDSITSTYLKGSIWLSDGTAGTPAIRFVNDDNTGFYRQGNDLLSFVANGQNAMNIDGTSGVGRLMIGNGSPVSRLQMNDDNNNAASGITFGGSSSTYLQLYKSASNKLALMGGNLGIGTTSPSTTLHVLNTTGGDGTWSGGILVENSGTSAGEPAVTFKNSATGSNYWFTGLNQADDYAFAYGTSFSNSTTKMIVLDSGYVGIGTTNPQVFLQVGEQNSGITSGAGIRIPDPAHSTWNAGLYYDTSNIFNINVGGRDINITGGWNSTISLITGNTSNRSGTVHVPYGPILGQGNILSNGTTPTSAYTANYLFYNGASDNWAGMGGYTGGQTWLRTQELSIWLGAVAQTPVKRYYFQADGRAYANLGWSTFSDSRLKENIQGITSPLEKVLALNGVYFDWKEDGSRDAGFIAQDVYPIIPEIVSVGSDGTFAIDYSKFSPFLAGAIKELNTKVDNNNLTLTQRIESQGTEIEMLKTQILAINPANGNNTNVINADTILAKMNIVDDVLVISGDTKVLGKATFKDINVGTISLTNNQIGIKGTTCVDEQGKANLALCEVNTLYLQKDKSGNVNFFNGAVVLDPTGKITAQQLEIDEKSQTIGSGTIVAGQTSVVIPSNKITTTSKIFVTATNSTNGQNIYVSAKIEGTSFTVSIQNVVEGDVTFDWFVVNSVPINNI